MWKRCVKYDAVSGSKNPLFVPNAKLELTTQYKDELLAFVFKKDIFSKFGWEREDKRIHSLGWKPSPETLIVVSKCRPTANY